MLFSSGETQIERNNNQHLKDKLTRYGIVCPICKGQITMQRNEVTCKSCERSFHIVHGIVDFHYPPKSLSPTSVAMLDHFENASLDDLIAILLRNANLPEKIIRNTLEYYKHQFERTEKMSAMFIEQFNQSFGDPIRNKALDLGCGSGAGILYLAQKFNQVLGVDASMAQLLLAKKGLHDLKTDNRMLIRANANFLPFSNNSLGYIQAINVLEHIMGNQKVIQEVSRCLMNQGGFVADSRNRYDIFSPEPHTGKRFLGFLPRKFIPKFVKRVFDIDYDQTWLLSYKECVNMMKKNFRGEYFVKFPNIVAYGAPNWLKEVLIFINEIPIFGNLLIRVFPTHLIVGKKQG